MWGLSKPPTAQHGCHSSKGFIFKNDIMPTISEIYETEHGRETYDAIHLFAEGNFWRAYEISAWLFTRVIHEFKVTKRLMKGIEDPVTFIGFPRTSLDKWLPKEAQMEKVDEKHIVISAPDGCVDADSVEELKGMFEIWKDNIEVSAPSKQNAQNSSPVHHTDSNVQDISITGVMREILAFPIESKTPMESMLFLAELKKKLSKII